MPNFLIMMLAEETILETEKEKKMTVIITSAKVSDLKDHSKISIHDQGDDISNLGQFNSGFNNRCFISKVTLIAKLLCPKFDFKLVELTAPSIVLELSLFAPDPKKFIQIPK